MPTSGDGVVAEEVTYGVGQKVLALFKPGKYLAAVITAAHDGGTFDVEYYDGDWVRVCGCAMRGLGHVAVASPASMATLSCVVNLCAQDEHVPVSKLKPRLVAKRT